MRNSGLLTILFSTVPRGLSARLTRGNFWEGAAIGLTVSALNHAAHETLGPKDPPRKKLRSGYVSKKQGSSSMEGKGSFVETWSNKNTKRGAEASSFFSKVNVIYDVYNE